MGFFSNSASGGGLRKDRQGVGTRPPFPVVPTEKCWGPGSSPLTRAAAEQARGGGAGAGGACAARGERPDCPVAESRLKAAENAGIRRRGLRAARAHRAPSQPAPLPQRPGGYGQDDRAGEC